MRHTFATVNQTCRTAARLLSEAYDRPLSKLERFGLRAHLIGCRSCRRYRDQLKVLAAVARGQSAARPGGADRGLSPEAKDRIRQALEAAHSDDAAGPDRG